MANKDAPFGFKPVKHLDGTPWNGGVMRCVIAAAETDPYGIGTTVILAGSANARGVPTVTEATVGATNIVLGAIVGFEADPDSLHPNYRPSGAQSADRICYVCVDPTVIYHVQDDAGATLTAADVGQNANITRAADPSATTVGVAREELGAADIAGDATYQLFILGCADVEDNTIGDNAIWEVLFNLSQLGNLPITGV